MLFLNGICAAGGVPIGTIFDFAGDADKCPDGFLVCGQDVSRAAYAGLFGIVGTKHGAGDGTTTFSLPPNGKVYVGKNTETEFNTVGKTGGEKTHLNTAAESGVPAHNHPVHAKLQAYGTVYNEPNTGSNGQGNWGDYTIGDNVATDASAAHNNLSPYAVVLKIIKY